jgi:hypothetical protein
MIRLRAVHQTVLHPRWLQIERLIDLEDGTRTWDLLCFPIEALALRAGEYALPLADPRALLDVVVYETLPGFAEAEHLHFPLMVTEPTIHAGRIKHLERVIKVRAQHEGRAGRRTLAEQRAEDARHDAVADEIILRSDLSPELAELGAYMIENAVAARRSQYLASRSLRARQLAGRAAANGDGTSTLLGELRQQREEMARGHRDH